MRAVVLKNESVRDLRLSFLRTKSAREFLGRAKMLAEFGINGIHRWRWHLLESAS